MRIHTAIAFFLLAACDGSSHVAPKHEPLTAPAPVQAEPVVPAPAPAAVPAAPALPAPGEWPITIHNASKRPIVLPTAVCGREPGWLTLNAHGQAAPLQLHAGCFCDEDLIQGRCPVRPAVCPENQYARVKPDASYTFRWNASHVVNDPEIGCSKHAKLPADLALEIEACWLDGMPDPKNRDHVPQQHCTKASAKLSDPAGVTFTVAQ